MYGKRNKKIFIGSRETFEKHALDLGCGEGGYSRELARKGAIVTAVDCAENAIKHCILGAEEEQLKITYHVRNSCDLYHIADDTFDIVLASMMLMDCEDFEGTVKEIKRVLKSAGKLFASVCHPCTVLVAKPMQDCRFDKIAGVLLIIMKGSPRINLVYRDSCFFSLLRCIYYRFLYIY